MSAVCFFCCCFGKDGVRNVTLDYRKLFSISLRSFFVPARAVQVHLLCDSVVDCFIVAGVCFTRVQS